MSSEDLNTMIGDAKKPRLVSQNDGLQVLRIGKRYKKRPVLREVSMTLKRGEVVGLLGPKCRQNDLFLYHYRPDRGGLRFYCA